MVSSKKDKGAPDSEIQRVNQEGVKVEENSLDTGANKYTDEQVGAIRLDFAKDKTTHLDEKTYQRYNGQESTSQIVTIEEYRKILKDYRSTDEEIKKRLEYLETFCRNIIKQELEKLCR
jgi:hypothetical protein